MKLWQLFGVGTLSVAAMLVTIDLLEAETSAVTLRDTAATKAALREAAATAAQFPNPSAWDAALFLPHRLPNEALARFKGTTVDILLPQVTDLRLTLGEVELNGGFGTMAARLKLHASTKSGAEIADLAADGRFLLLGLDKPAHPGDKATLRFGVVLDALRVERQLGSWKLAPRRWLAELAARKVGQQFEDKLTFAFPVPFDVSYDANYDKEHTFKTADNGSVTVKVSAPGAHLNASLDSASALFVPRGLWVGLKAHGIAGPTPPSVPAASYASKPLAELLARYEAQSSDSARAWINGHFLAGVINQLGALSPAARTATFKVVRHEGSLLNDNWYDKVLGKGGINVYLQNPEGDGGSAILNTSSRWTPQGLKVIATVNGNAEAAVHVHFDPLVSGGVGTSVGMKGGLTGGGEATMMMEKIDGAGGAHGFLFRPQLADGAGVKLELKTDGGLKFKFLGGMISATVPSLGARASLGLPSALIPRLVVLSNEPFPVNVLAGKDDRQGISITLPETLRDTVVVFDPKSVSTAGSGYTFDLDVHLATLSPDAAKQQRQAMRDALRQAKPEARSKSATLKFCSAASPSARTTSL